MWKVESAHHHEVLKEERGLDLTLPQLPPVETGQPQKSHWALGVKRGRAHGSKQVHRVKGMLNVDATSKMEPL